MRHLAVAMARAAEKEFDDIVADTFAVLLPSTGDFELARRYLQHNETGLRAGDALHLAIASNNRAESIYSFDNTLLKAGRRLGLSVRTIATRT